METSLRPRLQKFKGILLGNRLHPTWLHPSNYVLTRIRVVLTQLIETGLSHLASGEKDLVAVDLACGDMPYRSLFEPIVKTYLGIDLPSNPLADFHFPAEVKRFPLKSESADLVICTQALEHIACPAWFLSEARRICKQTGLLFLSTHGLWVYHPCPGDYWRWTGEGLRKLLNEQGWEVIDIKGIMGLAAVALQFIQDAIKLPPLLRESFGAVMQRAVAVADFLHDEESRMRNAAVYVVLARPREAPQAHLDKDRKEDLD